jgi:hypothetical protein
MPGGGVNRTARPVGLQTSGPLILPLARTLLPEGCRAPNHQAPSSLWVSSTLISLPETIEALVKGLRLNIKSMFWVTLRRVEEIQTRQGPGRGVSSLSDGQRKLTIEVVENLYIEFHLRLGHLSVDKVSLVRAATRAGVGSRQGGVGGAIGEIFCARGGLLAEGAIVLQFVLGRSRPPKDRRSWFALGRFRRPSGPGQTCGATKKAPARPSMTTATSSTLTRAIPLLLMARVRNLVSAGSATPPGGLLKALFTDTP